MNLDTITSLQTDFGRIYDENFKLRNREIYSKEIDNFNSRLEKAGISPKLSPKEIELKLQQTYELLMKLPKFADADKPNDMPTKTTLNAVESKELQAKAKLRDEQIAKTRENQSKLVNDFIDAQQKIQADIANSQKLQSKLQDKVVYAKVIIPEPLPLDEIEAKDLETLREFAQANEVTRTKLIEDLAIRIELKLENVPEEQKILIARTTAVEIVEKLAKPEVAIENQVQTAILTAIHEDKTNILSTVLKKDDTLLIAAKNGSTLLELENRNKDFFTKDVAKSLFGPKLADAIYGSSQVQVVLSETKIEGQTTHQVNLGDLNQNQIQILNHQNELLSSVKQVGFDKAGNVFTNYTRSYMAERIAKLPVGSAIKKAYSDPLVQSIFARYGLANPVVWQTVGNSQLVGLTMKFAPETAGPLLSFAGKALGKEFVKPVAGKVVGKVATDVGIKAGTGVGLAATITAAFAWTGPLAPVIGAVGAFLATSVAGETISNLWSKAKQWWTRNRDSLGPALAIGSGLTVATIFGAGPGLGVGILVAGATVGFGTLAVGAFGVLGFIGRSVGIAIAKPVIITLVALPPLIAFIMLVINNSAYVVPPSISNLLQNQDNLYVEVTKVAEPAGPFENSDLPLKIKYTITVKARRDALTNISFEHECKVVQENNTQNCTAPVEAPPTSISPASPYIYTYEANYNKTYTDALVINTFTVTADAGENKEETTSGSATITIGKPPAQCLKIDGNWPTGSKANIEDAIGKITAGYSSYVAKVCSAYPEGLPLRYNSSGYGNYWGWNHNEYIDFYQLGVKSKEDALYTLAHELGHSLAWRVKGIYSTYKSFPGIKTEAPYCFYKDTINFNVDESMQEAIAFQVIKPRCGNVQQKYPIHYKFIMNNVFN